MARAWIGVMDESDENSTNSCIQERVIDVDEEVGKWREHVSEVDKWREHGSEVDQCGG